MLYVDNVRIVGHNPVWVQMALTVVVGMFDRVGLKTNLGKTKSILCTPGFIRGKQGVAAYNRRVKGEGTTFRDQKINRVIC